MKYLVEDTSNEVRAGLRFPINSSIAGHFVIDVPDGLGISPSTSTASDLISMKQLAVKAVHPTLTGSLFEEFLDISSVDQDPSLSFNYKIGPNKRTAILPGGQIMTPTMTLVGSSAKVFFSFLLFTLGRRAPSVAANYPGPSDLLYCYDESTSTFSDPGVTPVNVTMMDSSGTSPVAALANNVVATLGGTNTSFRLRFVNTSSIYTFYMQEWSLLWGSGT